MLECSCNTSPLIAAHPGALSIHSNVPLALKNWFQTGGVARYFCQPETGEQWAEALLWAHAHRLPLCILGEGANILISDQGFDGLVIEPRIKNLFIHDAHNNNICAKKISEAYNDFLLVTAGAGVSFAHLIDVCLDHQAGGLEEFSGIPGTVGGSVFINIHYFNFLLSDFLVEARVIHSTTGTIEKVDKSWFEFGYNYSTLHKKNHFLIDATFKLKKIDPFAVAYARGRRDEIIRSRNRRPSDR